jgi:carboxyl-terminal processing protease
MAAEQINKVVFKLCACLNLSFLICLPCELATGQANADAKVSITERIFSATKVHSLLQLYFSSGQAASNPGLGVSFESYLPTVLATEDRPQFDLATIEFVAQRHNGHTFFWDTWLDQDNQHPLGFYAAPLDGYWVVQTSFLASLKPGNVIVSIDNTPTEAFFQQQQRYIAASSTAAQRHNLFLLPYLFPEQFTLTLDGDRKITINREKIKEPEKKTDGHWLKPGIIAYIRVPAFFHPPFEERALEYLRQFQDAKTLIIDVRNNGGGIPPKRLIKALMNRPYHDWKESTTARFALADLDPEDEKQRAATMLPEAVRGCKYSAEDHLCNLPVTWGGGIVAPTPHAFRGRVILLVDGGCVSACEELVEPFKDSGRGTLVGETTEGSSGLPYTYNFQNGMRLAIAVKRQYFPDGSEFEGVGIQPDVEVHPAIESLKIGRDVVLEKALELVEKP